MFIVVFDLLIATNVGYFILCVRYLFLSFYILFIIKRSLRMEFSEVSEQICMNNKRTKEQQK